MYMRKESVEQMNRASGTQRLSGIRLTKTHFSGFFFVRAHHLIHELYHRHGTQLQDKTPHFVLRNATAATTKYPTKAIF